MGQIRLCKQRHQDQKQSELGLRFFATPPASFSCTNILKNQNIYFYYSTVIILVVPISRLSTVHAHRLHRQVPLQGRDLNETQTRRTQTDIEAKNDVFLYKKKNVATLRVDARRK